MWGDKSKNNSGKRMCFYAQELNPKLGRARGLDLHSVASRLEAGLYAATEEPLEVRKDCILALGGGWVVGQRGGGGKAMSASFVLLGAPANPATCPF